MDQAKICGREPFDFFFKILGSITKKLGQMLV